MWKAMVKVDENVQPEEQGVTYTAQMRHPL
jgi:hypothetical protein